ncbi:MAG: chorismate mutase [Candidatus Micrarchaeota archaeon]|nr:chorismate mutase [Candidatus Micrarchaeota archaeon]
MINLKEVRVKIDQVNERVISGLKDRSRFPLNQRIYLPGAVEHGGNPNLSYLEFALQGLEVYHDSLGRFKFNDQYPMLIKSASDQPKIVVSDQICTSEIEVKSGLIVSYVSILPKLCKEGDNKNSYGETAYIDADLLERMHERVNIGRYVAQYKFDNNPILRDPSIDETGIRAALVDPVRESSIIANAKETARRFDLSEDFVAEFFRMLMDKTVDVEVEYIKLLRRQMAPRID